MRFESQCFHPNVDQNGNICLDILKEKWSAAYSVRTVLLSIQSLLGEPNNDSPLDAYAAKVPSLPLMQMSVPSPIPLNSIPLGCELSLDERAAQQPKSDLQLYACAVKASFPLLPQMMY